MIDMVKMVCNYTSLALNNRKCDEKIEDEQVFFTIAKENGLIPMVFEAMHQQNSSKEMVNHLKKHYYAFIAHDTQALKNIEEIDHILNENEIKHIFLKGSVLKSLYPKTYYRGMGDIDILIESNDLMKVHSVFKKHNIILKHKSEQHDSFEINHSMTIEIHPKLYKDFNQKYEVLFSNPWDHAVQFQKYRYQFDHTYEIVYLIYHLAKHLDTSGIGLRSLLDIGIYLDYHHKSIHIDHLIALLKQADMTKFFTQLVYLNIKYFGFNHLDDFLFDDLLDDQTYDDIIVFFSNSGLHGIGSKHNPFETRIVSYEKKDKSKLKLFLSIVFPNFKTMVGIFSFLKTLPFLLPIMWFYRWLKLILFKTKSTLKKIYQLKSVKDTHNLRDIYNHLGL